MKLTRPLPAPASVSLVVLLAACVSTRLPEDAPAVQTLPSAFAAPPHTTVTAPDSWWTAFRDPVLDRLIALALANNRDLMAAEAQARSARALARTEGWRVLPRADVFAASGRTRVTGSLTATDFAETGAEFAWELDVFARLRSGARAARFDALSVAEAARGVRVTIAAQTAASYIELRGAQARLDAARTNAEAQRQTLDRIVALREAGRGNPFDVARAREQSETTAALMATIESEITAAHNALDVLVAGLPAEIDLSATAPVPTPPPEIPVGSPSDLLERRPDIRRARAVLEAATARTQAARVDWWPRLSVFGLARWAGADFSTLGDSANMSFSLGPRIDWPALDIRRNALRVEAARANAEAEFHRYDRIVFASFREVETALANLAAANQAAASLTRAAAAANAAARVARLRYREGMEPFFSVLDAERRAAEADDRLAAAQTREALAYTRLGQALGVGWLNEARDGGAE